MRGGLRVIEGINNMKTGISYLTFDPDKHEFRYRKKIIPSVTQIIKVAGGYQRRNERAMLRGTNVHLATRYYDEGTIKDAKIGKGIEGYLDAYVKFRREHDFIFIEIEQPVFHKDYLYAGIPDRHGFYKSRECLLSIKSGMPIPNDILQEAGYVLTYADHHKFDLWAVYLKPSGDYKLDNIKDASAMQTFLNCLDIHNWKRRWRIS